MPRCPSCFAPLTRVEEEQIKSAVCANCFGTWINSVALLRRTKMDVQAVFSENGATGSAAAIQSASLSELAEMVQASDSKQQLRCPQCEKFMHKDRFHPM